MATAQVEWGGTRRVHTNIWEVTGANLEHLDVEQMRTETGQTEALVIGGLEVIRMDSLQVVVELVMGKAGVCSTKVTYYISEWERHNEVGMGMVGRWFNRNQIG